MNDQFTHLHVHGQGSLLDGYGTAEEIVLRAKELRQTNVALTDHGSMSQVLKFYNAAKANDINPLIGMEAYLTDDMFIKDKDTKTYHMGIIARNTKGLNQLYKLSYWAWNKGFYKKPRIDVSTFSKFYGEHAEDLLIISGCMDGIISQAFLSEGAQLADEKCDTFAKAFSHLVIEIQPWNPPELNHYLVDLADRKGLPLVVTCDSHYTKPSEKANAEINLLINQLANSKKTDKEFAALQELAGRAEPDLIEKINLLWPNRKIRFDKYENHMHSRESLEKLMLNLGIDRQDIYDNTYELTKDISVRINFKNYFPKYNKTLDSDDYLRELATDNMKDMGLETDEYKDRLHQELKVVEKLGFSDYFLVVWDVVHYAKSRNVMVGPGRGSVGGSLLAYVLGITRIDPIKYNLLFYRFLNIELEYNPRFEEVSNG